MDNKEFKFSSWGEMLGYCRAHNPGTKSLCRETRNYDWYLSRDWEDNMEMAINGWAEKAREAAIVAKPLYTKVSNLVEQDNINYDTEGSGIDVARFVEGIPECCQKFEPQIKIGKSNRILNMIINIGALGDIPAAIMTTKGGYALAMLDLLELGGYRVAVRLFSKAERRGQGSITVAVEIKSPDQSPDKNRLAYIMAHPSTLRRLVFSIRECEWGIGHVGGTVEYSPLPGEIYIPSANFFEHKNATDIEQMLLAELEKQGIINKTKGR